MISTTGPGLMLSIDFSPCKGATTKPRATPWVLFSDGSRKPNRARPAGADGDYDINDRPGADVEH
jgi:hypothetical protein